jgi:hypothetical protein
MGGTSIQQPAQPTVQSSITDYVTNYPRLVQLQGQYGPQEAAQQVALAQQYAGPMGQAYKTAQEAMYPNETALSNQITAQAGEGINSQMPSWMKEAYRSDFAANLGTNVGSPIGADFTSLGLMQKQKDWQDYYRNLGLSITGRQPIAQANTPQVNQSTQGFTPTGVMGFNQQGYGTQMNAFSQQQSQGNPYFNAIAGMGGMALGGFFGRPR